jgi:hypothetical protein
LDLVVIGEFESSVTLDVPEGAASGDGADQPDRNGRHGRRDRRLARRRHGVRRLLDHSLTTWFLIIAIPVGTFLVFAIPAFQGLDEPNHFLRVWSVTDGTITVPTTNWDQRSVDINGVRAHLAPGTIRRDRQSRGVVVDHCLARYIAVNLDDAARKGPMDPGRSYRSPSRCAGAGNVFESIDNTATNSPLAYAPHVVAVGVLRLFGAPLPLIFFGGRLFGLAVYLALAALAIRLAPRGKGLLFVIALLPMSLQSAATYNADALLLAASLLVVALTLRCCLDHRAGWGSFAALAGVAWLVALCKEPYGLLALLVLLVPAVRLAGRTVRGRAVGTRWVTAIKVGVVAVAGLLTLGWWTLGVRGSSLASQYPKGYINQHVQSFVLLHHPATALTTIVHTLENTASQRFTALSAFLELGFFRNQSGGSTAPVLIAILGTLALFAAYTCELAGGRFRARLAPSGTAVSRTAWLWLPALVVVVFAAMLLVETFVRITPPGARVLDPMDGIPGRYFLPLLAVPMVTVALAQGTGARRVPKGWLMFAMVAMAAYLVVKVFTRFW